MKHFQLLQKLAQRHGIQTSYFDVTGQQRDASAETLSTILAALDVRAKNDTEVSESLRQLNADQKVVEPVNVSWEGKPAKIPVHLKSNLLRRNIYCHLQLETGETQNWSFRLDEVPSKQITKSGNQFQIATKIALPELPPGYHRFEIETAEGISSSLIISAPKRSYSSPKLSRTWGAFLPMYAAHSEESWGAGNFSDWRNMTEWIASLGGGVVGCLPILPAFLDETRCEPSPYSPTSRLFWNEFFIDVTRVPEWTACREAQKIAGAKNFQQRLAKFRGAALVDYGEEMKARRSMLEVLARFFFSTASPRRTQFENFLRERPQLRDYAAFRAAGEKMGAGWPSWPERMRQGKLRPGDFSETTARYHQFVQWIAQQQMDDVLKTCRERNVSFYLDLPLGVHPDGYDVWREREVFAQNMNAGAPPDIFFTRGQDWGFAPLHPQKAREQGYRYFLEMLRFQMRHTGLLRIDHVMNFHRLYWIPKGAPASDGAYVNYPAEEFYAMLCLESHRHKCVIVGENLGTVPPAVDESMQRHQLRQMYVLQYEAGPDPKKALRAAPRRVVASLNTHDMPAFAAFWTGEDIHDRFKLGLIKKENLNAEMAARKKLTDAVAKFLSKQSAAGFQPAGKKRGICRQDAGSTLKACLHFLAASDAEIVLVNLEDLWGEKQPQNVPGTSSERPNWRRKAKFTIEEMENMEALRKSLETLIKRRRAV